MRKKKPLGEEEDDGFGSTTEEAREEESTQERNPIHLLQGRLVGACTIRNLGFFLHRIVKRSGERVPSVGTQIQVVCMRKHQGGSWVL